MAETTTPPDQDRKGEAGSSKKTAPTKNPSGDVAPKPPLPDNLDFEQTVDLNLPFVTPFSHPSNGGRANSEKEKFYEILAEMYGETPSPSLGQLVTMRRMDGQVRALYRLLTLPIKAALKSSTFVAAEDGDAEAEFIEQVFHLPPEQGGMSVTFSRFMSQLLMALFDGFAAFEQVYTMPEYGPMKGKYALKKLSYCPPETVTFVSDDRGGFAGFRQRATIGGKQVDEFVAAENAYYYASQEEERKFHGVSFFESAFYHYDKKIKTYYVSHLAGQRAAVGTRLGTYPANANQQTKNDFKASLANLSVAQFMAVPEEFKVEVLKEGGSFDFLSLINHHNSQMSKSILANFFDKEQGAGANEGSLVNFAQPGDEMFTLMLRGIMDDIANSINHYIIPRLIDWNFDSGKYPVFTWSSLTDEQKAAISTTFQKLASTQSITPEFMRELEKNQAEEMGLDIDYEEVEAREQEEAQQQEQLMKEQMSAQAAAQAGLPTDPTQVDAKGEIAKLQKQIGLSASSLMDAAAVQLEEESSLLLAGRAGRRRVQTSEGAKKYGQAVGSVIRDDKNGSTKKGRTVTMTRLISLKRLLNQAMKSGDEAAIKRAKKNLSTALSQYSSGKDSAAVKAALNTLAGTGKTKTPVAK